jgi:hypothetical protein
MFLSEISYIGDTTLCINVLSQLTPRRYDSISVSEHVLEFATQCINNVTHVMKCNTNTPYVLDIGAKITNTTSNICSI